MKYLSQSAMATASKHIPALNYSLPRYTSLLCFLTTASSPNPVSLIGPPEIYRQPPATPAASATKKSDPFMDPMLSNFNKTAAKHPPMLANHNNVVLPPMGLTENGSPTFVSSANPCLDFFFHVVPDTPPETLIQRLELAWNHDPLRALKLLCNLRGVRGTGKCDKEGGYTAALWLHENHPKTLACNVASFADFGYFKDLLEILFRLLEGPDALKHGGRDGGGRINGGYRAGERTRGVRNTNVYKMNNVPKSSHEEKRIKQANEEKRIERAKKVVGRFNNDPDFKFLHDRVSDYFAECLRSDMKMLESGRLKQISLAAKWCPSLDLFYDQTTLLCETIGKKVFPRDEYPEYQGVEEAHYAYSVRDRLRKQVLVPLRRALELPEVYMSANEWGSIPYNRVASVAMSLYKRNFSEHDGERFQEYLGKVEKGEATIAAGALLPHEIIGALNYDDDSGQVAELQWKRVVEDMSRKGKLNNCLAVCDVSGSMSGTPMEVSVALGVLVSELSDEPWKGKVITFSANPELQAVVGNSLKEKTEFVRRMDWGMNTDFQKVFDLLLQVAVDGKLKPEQMIKRLFVFSDMEFDEASRVPQYGHNYGYGGYYADNHNQNQNQNQNRTWETDYEAIVRKFTEKGYGECVPEIVFWNLRDSVATPVPANQPGVALVSGFSKNLMNVFLDEGGILNPEAVMDVAISGEEYQKLVVVD